MRRILQGWLVACVCLATSLYATIIETTHFKELPQYVTPTTLVLLDIDDTLLIPVQMLGNDVWFRSRLQEHRQRGLKPEDALDRALAEWEAIRHLTQVQIVEEGSQEVVRSLQNQGVVVMGLTTQGLALANRTVRQLAQLGVDLRTTAPSRQDQYFMNGQGVLLRDGVLFTAGTHKGRALMQLLATVGYRPEAIVFINDKATHLQELADSADAAGIPFIGLRYGYSDPRLRSYRPEIADVQFHQSSFARIVSDAEAEALLLKGDTHLP